MLQDDVQKAGILGQAITLHRFQMYSQIRDDRDRWAFGWSPGAIWTEATPKAGTNPTRVRGPAVSRLPESPHFYYLFGRRPGSVQGELLLTVKKRGPRVTIPSGIIRSGRSDWRLAAIGLPFEISPAGAKAIADIGDRALRYFKLGEQRGVTDATGIAAVLPFLVTKSMVKSIRFHQKNAARVTDPSRAADIPREEARFTIPSYPDLRLAEVLAKLLGNGGYFHDVSDKLLVGANDEVARITSAAHQLITAHTLTAERIGGDLASWVEGDLVSLACEHVADTEESCATMLRELEEISEGLFDTSTGVASLASFAQGRHQAHYLCKAFSNSFKDDAAQFRRLRYATKSALRIYSFLHGSDTLLQHKNAARFLSDLEDWVGTALFENPKKWKSGAIAPLTKTEINHVGLSGIKQERLKNLTAKLESIKLDPGAREQLKVKVDFATDLFFALDFANTCLAYAAVFEAAEKADGELIDKSITAGTATLGLIGQVFSKQIDNMTNKELKLVAKGATNIASLWYVYKNYNAATGAAALGDNDAAFVMYAAATTEAVSFAVAVGTVFAGEGTLLAAALGPIGAVVSMIGGVLYLTYEVLKDSELALAVSYTRYGNLPIEDVPQKVTWCPLSPKAMKVDPNAAVVGLEFGLRQFKVTAEERPKEDSLRSVFMPRIYVGHIDTTTSFVVTWKWKTNRASGTTIQQWTIDAHQGSKSIRPLLAYDTEDGWHFDVPVPEGIAELAAADLRAKVSIQKHFSSLKSPFKIPHRGPVEIHLHPAMANDTLVRSSSIDKT